MLISNPLRATHTNPPRPAEPAFRRRPLALATTLALLALPNTGEAVELLALDGAATTFAATHTVTTYSQLLAAINLVNGSSGGDTIQIGANITLSAALPALTKDVTIEGGGFTVSGNNSFRVFTVAGGNVTINNANLINGRNTGANGGSGGTGIL